MANLQPIVGEVLAWAILDAGLSTAELDRELKIDGAVGRWITEEERPNQGQLEKIAARLSRPVSFFFLPRPPSQSSTPARFRVFAGTTLEPGPKTSDGVELARTIQQTAKWISQRIEKQRPELPTLSQSMDVEEAALVLRAWLDWSTNLQTSSDYAGSKVQKLMRTRLEARGILVLHLTLEENLARGFSLYDENSPLIAINTKDDPKPRVFSYLHELVHLCVGSTAVCDVHTNDDKLERFCNRVAAAFLMPQAEFTAHVRSKLGRRLASSVEDVALIRSRFRVSLRAAAIRAEHLGLGVKGLFDLVDEQAESRKQGGGGTLPGMERTKPRVRVDTFGPEFIRTVERGVRKGVLKERQAAELLRISKTEWSNALQIADTGFVA